MSTLIDSYSESNWDFTSFNLSSDFILGQSFEAGEPSINITSAKFYIQKDAGATGNLSAAIYEHSGTYGTSSVGTGTKLASSDVIDLTSLGTSYNLVEFSFSGQDRIKLPNTYYIITIERSGGSGFVEVTHDSTTLGHSGNSCRYDGSWTYDASKDRIFYVYGDNLREISGISSIQGISSITL